MGCGPAIIGARKLLVMATTVVYNSSFRCYGFQRPLNWRIVIEAELAGRLGYLLP